MHWASIIHIKKQVEELISDTDELYEHNSTLHDGKELDLWKGEGQRRLP